MKKIIFILLVFLFSLTFVGCNENKSTVNFEQETSVFYRIPGIEWDQNEIIIDSNKINNVISFLEEIEYNVEYLNDPHYAINSQHDTSILFINFYDNKMIFVVDESGSVYCEKQKYGNFTQRLFVSQDKIDRYELLELLGSTN